MNICRLRYELLVSPHLRSLPILMSYTQGTVLHWKMIYSTHSRYTLYGFLLSSLSQLLHSKKKILELVPLTGTLLVQAPVFGIEDQTIQWMDLKALMMHLQETARQNTTIGSRFCNPFYSSLCDQMPCMFVSMWLPLHRRRRPCLTVLICCWIVIELSNFLNRQNQGHKEWLL